MRVIGLNSGGLTGGDAGNIDAFRRQTQVSFPLAADGGQSYSRFAGPRGVSPFPLDVVIDRSGVIRFISREYNAEQLAQAVRAAL